MNTAVEEWAPLRPGQAAVLAMVEAQAPVSCAHLAQQYGCTHDRMQVILRQLRGLGLVSVVGGGCRTTWVPQAMAAQAIAAHREHCRLRHLELQRAYKKRAAEEENDAFVRAPTQVIVPAHQCAPIRPPAPASVFNWALQA